MSHIEKIKLYKELEVIMGSIIKDIVEPITGISNVKFDPWLTDIDTWTQGDYATNELILSQIAEKYGFMEEQEIYFDSYTTMMQIALFIYFNIPDST